MSSTAKLKTLLRSGGHTELLTMVLSADTDFMSLAKEASFAIGKSPMHLAVETGSIAVVKELEDLGFDLNSVEYQPGVHYCSALHVAVMKRDLVMVKALLALGANCSLLCKIDNVYVGTAECFARAKGYPEIANAIGNTNIGTVDGFKVGTLSSAVRAHRQYKSSISTKLRKAQEVKTKCEALVQETKRASKQLKESKAKKARFEAALRREELKVQTLEEQIKQNEEKKAMLASHPDNLTSKEIVCLENTMKDLSKEEAGLRDDQIEVDVLDCVVCLTPPSASAYTCQACDHLVCHDCLNKLTTCPTCRVSFAVRPARRNKIVERMLEKMNAARK